MLTQLTAGIMVGVGNLVIWMILVVLIFCAVNIIENLYCFCKTIYVKLTDMLQRNGDIRNYDNDEIMDDDTWRESRTEETHHIY